MVLLVVIFPFVEFVMLSLGGVTNGTGVYMSPSCMLTEGFDDSLSPTITIYMLF